MNHQLATHIELENDQLLDRSFQWNPNHPLVNYKMKTIMTVSPKQKEPIQTEEENYNDSITKAKRTNPDRRRRCKRDFPMSYLEV
jgi:hypothetical protein